MRARSQVTEKLKAGRKRCSSRGWTQPAEIDLLCEFWSRLANGNTTCRFPFKSFGPLAVYDKLTHMEKLLNDDKLFRMPTTAAAAGDGTQVSGWPPLPPMAVRVALAVR